MRANELSCKDLMTGDYVRHKKTKDIIWIFEIDNDRAVINNESDSYCSERNISINDIEPIPLTPEILEKNGFKLDKEDGWWWLTPKIGITFWEEDDIELEFENKNSSVNIHIKYVHQLQHALRLCRIEKEIKLED